MKIFKNNAIVMIRQLWECLEKINGNIFLIFNKVNIMN